MYDKCYSQGRFSSAILNDTREKLFEVKILSKKEILIQRIICQNSSEDISTGYEQSLSFYEYLLNVPSKIRIWRVVEKRRPPKDSASPRLQWLAVQAT